MRLSLVSVVLGVIGALVEVMGGFWLNSPNLSNTQGNSLNQIRQKRLRRFRVADNKNGVLCCYSQVRRTTELNNFTLGVIFAFQRVADIEGIGIDFLKILSKTQFVLQRLHEQKGLR